MAEYTSNVREGVYRKREFIEFRPHKRVLRFRLNSTYVQPIEVALPYVQLWKCPHPSILSCSITHQPLTADEQVLYTLPLPHQHRGLMCLGGANTQTFPLKVRALWETIFVVPFDEPSYTSITPEELHRWAATGELPPLATTECNWDEMLHYLQAYDRQHQFQ